MGNLKKVVTLNHLVSQNHLAKYQMSSGPHGPIFELFNPLRPKSGCSPNLDKQYIPNVYVASLPGAKFNTSLVKHARRMWLQPYRTIETHTTHKTLLTYQCRQSKIL